MGAGAFVIAEFTRTPYMTIVLVSIVPALLYFLTVYFLVDFQALKQNLSGLKASELPRPWEIFKQGWFLLTPLVVIFVLILMRYSPAFAAFWGIVAGVAVGFIPYRGERTKIRDIATALADGAKNAASISGLIGTIGILIGVVSLTGLGLRLSDLVVSLSGGHLLIAIVLVTLASWVLGMGLTATSSYIVVAILAAPALQELGTSLIAAHLIIFWVSQDANVTPPVCISAFGAASIAGGDPMKTGWESWKLARGLYIVPLLMAYSPLVDGPWTAVVPVLVFALPGIYAMCAGLSGYLRRETTWWERAALLGSGVLLIAPEMISNVAGLVLLAAVWLWQRRG